MTELHSVEKIGGTSMAATRTVFDNVLIGGRTGADLYRRMFVVSAFAGITDLLLEHKKNGEAGVYAQFVSDEPDADWSAALNDVRDAMRARNNEMFTVSASCIKANEFVDERIATMRTCLEDLDRLRAHGQFLLTEPLATIREMLSGLGEAHSAHSTSLLLQDRGVNAVFVDLTGWGDSETPTLDERISAALDTIDVETSLPIITGYAASKAGTVRRYDRGYSEIIFSRLAVLSSAREAIIHKEFHLSSADPRLVGTDKARKIGRTNYDVADQLANLGMEAIHPGAGQGLRHAYLQRLCVGQAACRNHHRHPLALRLAVLRAGYGRRQRLRHRNSRHADTPQSVDRFQVFERQHDHPLSGRQIRTGAPRRGRP